MRKTKLCIVAVGSLVHAEMIVAAARHAFQLERALIAHGLRGAADVLGSEAYDFVIIDGVANVHDGWTVALGVSTSQFRRFNGWAWNGTGRDTPVILIVPQGERFDVHGMTNVSIVEEPIERDWFIRQLEGLQFVRRTASAPSEAETPVVESK